MNTPSETAGYKKSAEASETSDNSSPRRLASTNATSCGFSYAKLKSTLYHYKETICSLLIGIAFFLMTDEWFEKWKAYRLHFVLSVLPFITHVVWIYANRRNQGAYTPDIPALTADKAIHKGWLLALIAVVSLFYAGIAFWNYCAWWIASTWEAQGYPWEWMLNWYMNKNARLGEFVLRGIRLDSSRWFVWVTLPFFIMLPAYASARLNGWKLTNLCSSRGVAFVVLVISTCLLSVNTKHTRDYTAFAQMTNYLWPTVITLLLISVFVNNRGKYHFEQNNIRHAIRLSFIFLIGIYCGWGTEVGCIMFTAFALCWFAFHIWKKRYIAKECWAAVLGFLWGTSMIFASPAHAGRSAASYAGRLLNPQNMTIAQLNAWLDTLDWDKINMLRSYGIVILDGIPMLQHLKFFPFLAEQFWGCCHIPSIVLLVLLAFVMSRPGIKYRRRTILFIAVGGFGLAWLGSASYLIACIPSDMSYLPASFVILLTCGWVFLQLPYKWVPQTIMSITMFSIAICTYAPAAIKAYPYKALEKEMWRDIRHQKANNIQDVKLDSRYFVNVKNDMGLISGGKLHTDPKIFPNRQAARYFKVRSIRVMKEQKKQEGSNK